MEWIDSHCHVPWDGQDVGRFRIDETALDDAAAAGVVGFVSIGTDRAQSLTAMDVASRRADVWATIGLHPHDAKDGVASVADLFDSSAASERVVAVGECGLDFHYDHSPRDVQRAAFASQVEWAHLRDRALVIHTREAWPDTFAVLDDVGVPERTVFHCFTGGPSEAEQCLRRGAYLSFSGIVSFPGAAEVREAAGMCPRDRLLVETDAPYLAPVPYRGRPNTPAWLPIVGQAVAEARNCSVSEVADATLSNTRLVFRLPDSKAAR